MGNKIIMTIILLCLVISGCQSKTNQDKKEVTILYSSIADFEREYGFLYDKFKDINIKVIEFTPVLGNGTWNAMRFLPTSNKDWDAELYIKLVKDTKPDILFFPQSIYSKLLNQNMLADISTYIDKGELTGINPDIIDSIKEIGDGRLYALSDTISSQALFFNKDLFKQYGISEPTNNMSWGYY